MQKRFLFINFGGLGDEILFLPSIISVKKEYPDSKITLALEPRSKGILAVTDVIDDVIFADIKNKNKYIELFKLLFKIWCGHYDTVVSSGANKFISIFLFLTFISKKYGYNTGKLSEILLTKAIPLNKQQYAVNMYQDLVQDITENRTELPEFCIKTRNPEPNTVLVHPGVSKLSIQKGMIKTVSKEVWAETIQKLSDRGKKVILAGGPDDEEIVDYISKHVPAEKYINMFGKTKNLKELAELISKSEIFLCSDSAPLHIAVGFGVKTFAIFGSTDDKKLIPNNGKVIPIKADCECKLQPCLWEKRQTTCETLDCLKISSDKIVQNICDKM